MTENLRIALFLFGLLPTLSAVAQDNDVKAAVAISIQQDQEIWAGQQVTLNLDLKTTGFSFSNTHFNLPEVPGAFLMQTDTTTLKMTENTDGQSWQIIRYPLALYPQKAGQLEIPTIAVRFSTSAGFGSTERMFEFQTKPLLLSINSPPGVKEGDLVITTLSFKLDYEWQPESGAAQSGDALTLMVKRSARDISAMMLPPLPVFHAEGLAVYPQTPELNDRTNRGDLTGERIDRIIWVAEKPGTYDIPGIRFQWWDPDSRELKQQIIPGLSLDISPSRVAKVTADVSDKPGQFAKNYLWLLLAVFTALTAGFLYLRFGRKAWGPTAGQAVATEKSTFSALQKACKSNQAAQTHAAIHAWLAWSSPGLSSNSRSVTLSEFAGVCDDAQLAAELERLQEALVSSVGDWKGGELLNALQGARRKISKQKIVQSKVNLAPLNP